jgi:hypothetical protein
MLYNNMREIYKFRFFQKYLTFESGAVLIQKDKRQGLGSHMEKCVFVGYPQGYKGWTFYNPTTKKTVISERANFDERYFPLSMSPMSASIPPPSAAVENTPAITPPPVLRPSTGVPKPASTPYYIPPDSDDSDSDDESSSDESLDHGGDIVLDDALRSSD